MSNNTIYLLSFLIPLVLTPMVLPAFELVAYRKRITDGPGPRKRQSRPVPLMGGTVMMLVICVTSIVINLFCDISPLFPVICVMCMLYIFGMMDDTIGLGWGLKLILQIFAVLMLHLGTNYGFYSVYGIHLLENLSPLMSGVLTVFCGVMLLNAVNFSDGIDGLASAFGVMVGIVMGYWHTRHGFVTQAIISFIMVGVMSSFFFYNVFSKRYKSYMGDSGSLVLGLFIFIAVTNDRLFMLSGSFLADSYSFSFIIALLSVMLFDLIRVVVLRVLRHKVPYEGDRTHLHHLYVDMGMNHLMATVILLLSNLAVIGVWFVSAITGMPILPQLLLTILGGVVFVWLPYFQIVYLRRKHPSRYDKISSRYKKIASHVDCFVEFMGRVIDARWSKKHSKEKFN